jgi:hypothetical protein
MRRLRKFRKISKRATILLILVVFVSTLLFIFYRPRVHAQTFLTSGTTWTVPTDWNNTNNTIDAIGGGGGGAGGFTDASGSGGGGGGGGGAGGFSRISNASLSPGTTVTIAVGGGGASVADSVNGNAGGDTYLCNSTSSCTSITDSAVVVGAKGGGAGLAGTSSSGGTGGAGGATAGGVGSTKTKGGDGASPSGPASAKGSGGGGGGGAAGASANGNNGAANTSTTVGGVGGQGDGTSGGAAGSASGGTGGNGTEYDGSHGSGGGGGGGDGISNGSGFAGGSAGIYGAAGGGGGGNGNKHGTGGTGAAGQPGIIRIVYSFVSLSDYRWRSDDGNETTGSSLASQDTAASIVSGTAVRLRVLIKNTGDSTTDNFRLEYTTYSNGCDYTSWTAVPATATTEHFNMYNTANYTDQTASTNVSSGPAVITDPSGYSFAAGKLVSNSSNSASIALTSTQFTEIEYAITTNSNTNKGSYCFRVTNAGTALDSYSNYPILNINYPPSTPTVYSVANSATNVPRLPIFQLRSYDLNKDYLKYVVETCPVNSFPCSSGGQTYAESDSCWSGRDTQSGAAYTSTDTETTSTMTYCSVPTSGILSPNTTYYWRAKAIDPGGSNTYSSYTSVLSFTTGTLDVWIKGGTNINGGTKVGN